VPEFHVCEKGRHYRYSRDLERPFSTKQTPSPESTGTLTDFFGLMEILNPLKKALTKRRKVFIKSELESAPKAVIN
jgi:hypothetical protein